MGGTAAGLKQQDAMNAQYPARVAVQAAGGSIHTRYWIPAEECAEFNAKITGLIAVAVELRIAYCSRTMKRAWCRAGGLVFRSDSDP